MLLDHFRRLLGVDSETSDQELTAATFINDLGADSLDAVELVMAIEEEYDINIPDEVAEQLKTIGDVIRYIDRHRRGGKP